MKRVIRNTFLASLFLAAIPLPSRAEDDRLQKLGPEHRKWLVEEVIYIILDREREVFLSLETVDDRNRFIEAFWRKRDPNRATPENEFKEEHYRRIEYANKFLGRETFRKGWQTDRGRMHIILGEPVEIQRFDGYQSLVSQHLWFYGGDPAKGLPAFFYLLFFKHQDVGEFKLYSPLGDGPNRLVQGQFGLGSEPRQALEVLRNASPELARASLSLDTSDSVDLRNPRPSLSSDIVMARIYESPKRAVRPDYADAWLNYRDRVSAEYSFNYVPSRSYFAVLNGPDETPFVNYAIELDPQNFSIETDEDQTKFYTTLDVSVEARNKDGIVVFAKDREDYLELNAGQFQNARASPISYQSNFPLLPGEYDVSVILRNRVLKQYTVAETTLVVPAPSADKLVLSDVVLGYAVDELQRTGAAPDELRTFQIGNSRVQPAADSIFSLGETIHVFLQVEGASRNSQVHFALMNG
ncbi:MAG: GWxTD domain-containing protein, partial [Vicinamibacteria bacterium]